LGADLGRVLFSPAFTLQSSLGNQLTTVVIPGESRDRGEAVMDTEIPACAGMTVMPPDR
jgi:hypothetical protein